MRIPKTVAIAHKKPDVEMLKKSKTGANKAKKEKASKKSSNAPKRPASAFFVFMEEFRKSFKENFPDVKSVSADKALYVEIASKRKADYEKAVEAYKKLFCDLMIIQFLFSVQFVRMQMGATRRQRNLRNRVQRFMRDLETQERTVAIRYGFLG
ncbi:hypothetical protein TIFTF001_027256 [Ficus carica]|uniref:HMG box domain-containing protein n=1 Tax=Ficus carica TaxID=3494 RepID=A0AA88DN12_FICCA|nr:hypothetical protein TIFTF001_027256 [Ficus carica]